jgi:hypothetical protein
MVKRPSEPRGRAKNWLGGNQPLVVEYHDLVLSRMGKHTFEDEPNAFFEARGDAGRVAASSGALSFLDDNVLLFVPTEVVDQGAIGSICGLGDGTLILAKVQRTRKTGEASLVLHNGKIEDAILSTATPIIAMIP